MLIFSLSPNNSAKQYRIPNNSTIIFKLLTIITSKIPKSHSCPSQDIFQKLLLKRISNLNRRLYTF